MTKKIRVVRDSPVDRCTTEIEVHPTTGGVEFIIDQSVYDNWKKRYKPLKLVIFTLDSNQVEELKCMLASGGMK